MLVGSGTTDQFSVLPEKENWPWPLTKPVVGAISVPEKTVKMDLRSVLPAPGEKTSQCLAVFQKLSEKLVPPSAIWNTAFSPVNAPLTAT